MTGRGWRHRVALLLALGLAVGCKTSDPHPARAGAPDARPSTPERAPDRRPDPETAGSTTLPLAGPRSMPDTFPKLAGAYVSSKEHPRVYETQAELADMAQRVNVAGSFSAQRFERLVSTVKRDLATKTDWGASYSGCDIYVYLHAFSITAMSGYAGQTKTEQELATAVNAAAGASPPIGAALVASRLALYAALVKAGARVPAGGPSASEATATAKRILLAWADHGFRDSSGRFRDAAAQYCEDGKPAKPVAIVLQIARGIVYSVQAHDLLAGLGALSADEAGRAERFHGAMYDVIRAMANEEYAHGIGGVHGDELYNNQFAADVNALVATARLLDDAKRLDAALHGGEGALKVELPFTKLFSYVVYGVDDRPLTRITPNSSDDARKSSPAYSSPVVAPGEINDRFRNATVDQGIGYPMGTLEWLYMTAEVLRLAGYEPFAYRGTHRQTLEMATQYYACYAKAVGFDETITADAAKACPDHEQYVGKVVNDVETNVVMGAYRFPSNRAIVEVEAAAKAASLHDGLDSVRFGRWRD